MPAAASGSVSFSDPKIKKKKGGRKRIHQHNVTRNVRWCVRNNNAGQAGICCYWEWWATSPFTATAAAPPGKITPYQPLSCQNNRIGAFFFQIRRWWFHCKISETTTSWFVTLFLETEIIHIISFMQMSVVVRCKFPCTYESPEDLV